MNIKSKGQKSGSNRQAHRQLQQGPQQPKSVFDFPFLQGPSTRSWSGNSHNTALAAVAAIEDEDTSDGVNEHHAVELANAPMFRLLAEEFEAKLKQGEDNGVTIAMFAARVFLAGTLWRKTALPPERNTISVSRELLDQYQC